MRGGRPDTQTGSGHAQVVQAFSPLIIVVLIVAFAGTAIGASGATFVLGKTNSANKPTTMKNTAKGPALRLKTKSKAPNLKVSNRTRIPRLNADLVDGLSSEAFQRRVTGSCPADTAVRGIGTTGATDCTAALARQPVRTIVVSPGATPVASGAALLDAMARTDPSADSPWLVKLEPGVYDLGTSTLRMKAFVDLEGSGRETTTIIGNDSQFNQSYVVIGARNSEVRGVTLHLDHVDGGGSGIVFDGTYAGGWTYLFRVRLVSETGTAISLFTVGGDNRVIADEVIAESPGRAVNDNGSSSIIFRNGEVRGTYKGRNEIVFINTMVAGLPTNDSTNVRCLNSYSESFVALSTACSPAP